MRLNGDTPARTIDLFCRVVDNYGDIGVCWRLARQLAQPPFSVHVRLWVDKLEALCALAPDINPALAEQWHARVHVVHWTAKTTPAAVPYAVVIEAFACDPPADFVQRMSNDTLWINLEYLSAEDWVETCHGLASPQAQHRKKWFFFPGFTPKTGGLLRETNLLARRDTWQANPQARWQFLHSLGVPSSALQALQQGALQVLLFCYAHAPVTALLQGLCQRGTPVVVLACPGTVNAACKDLVRGSLVQVHDLPFIAQTDFDHLLWSSDLNCVRGEDSLVRALWAARPLLWHIYPQAEQTHLTKLNAWLARAPYPVPAAQLMRDWNIPPHTDLVQQLEHCLAPTVYRHWKISAQQWSDALAQQSDLASALMAFCTKADAISV